MFAETASGAERPPPAATAQPNSAAKTSMSSGAAQRCSERIASMPCAIIAISKTQNTAKAMNACPGICSQAGHSRPTMPESASAPSQV